MYIVIIVNYLLFVLTLIKNNLVKSWFFFFLLSFFPFFPPFSLVKPCLAGLCAKKPRDVSPPLVSVFAANTQKSLSLFTFVFIE